MVLSLPLSSKHTFIALVSVGLLFFVFRKHTRRGVRTPKLRGPPGRNLLFGATKQLIDSEDPGAIFEAWAAEYGHVYQFPTFIPTGKSTIALCDPKAIAHFFSKQSWTYVLPKVSKNLLKKWFGPGLLWSEGEDHKRQRKALTPAFSNAAIRRLTSVFYDSSYQLKAAWDTMLESEPNGVVIDVQNWMNHITLDSIGIAGFSHDFGTLRGKHSDVAAAFEGITNDKPNVLEIIVLVLSAFFPILARTPITRNVAMDRLTRTMTEISEVLLDRSRKEKEGSDNEDNSIIGLLIKAENAESGLQYSKEEVLAQMNVLLLAGYETTSSKSYFLPSPKGLTAEEQSVSLTWALIELARNPEIQDKLRKELLSQFAGSDPSWEQLGNSLPYLDAVVHEVLRLHPPAQESLSIANQDDVLPLSTPIVTKSGQTIYNLPIAKGTAMVVSISCMNRAEWIWGENAKHFVPERWLEPDFGKYNEIQGYRHLLTFVDGPRTCLGRGFALTEFKAVLSVIIRHFVLEFDEPEPKIVRHISILVRPKFEGLDEASIFLRVRRVE